MEKWFRERILPFVVISIIAALGKMSYDVYAFSTVKKTLVLAIDDHKKRINTLEKETDNKAEQSDLNNLHNKINNILTGLCMINEKTCKLRE